MENPFHKDVYPMLRLAFFRGDIRIEGKEIIGTASDGAEVNIGDTYDRESIKRAERYLTERPTPDKW